MSPIEQQMVHALLQHIPSRFSVLNCIGFEHAKLTPNGVESEYDADSEHDGLGDEFGDGADVLSLWRQVSIGSYRIDLVLQFLPEALLLIECDGHDWHERTKQQAAYDRSRDRDLLKRGLIVARFTGSEIVHSPERCAADVYEIMQQIIARAHEPLSMWESGFKQGRLKVVD